MDKDLNDSDLQTSQDDGDGQSLVGKLKRNVSEIISNTPLSKWFRKPNDATPVSTVRRRQDDSENEEDTDDFQPPTKRTKLPYTKEALSLNVSEVLSPISTINHVKKTPYRSFPEPIAGPSGYQTRKMLNSTSISSDSINRNTRVFEKRTEEVFKNPNDIIGGLSEGINKEIQSDSEESTSGYSSGRVGSKEIVSQESSKQTSPRESSPRKNRSLFQSSSAGRLFTSDHSLSPNRNSNLSSRMPSFNPSTFGSSSFVDRTLSSKRILNSPFYNGRTIYGGASAYGQSTRRAPQDVEKMLRQSVRIKPANRGIDKGDLQLGKTARRILDTLEQYSSPVSDAKKIPVVSKKPRIEGSLTRFIGANPYIVRENRSASNRELQVPSVTDLLKMKMDQQKTKLQNSTEAARQIATKSSDASTDKEYQIPVQKEKEKHTTKIKNRITSVRKKAVIEETVPEVNLTPISLPIKELPKFDFNIPPPAESPSIPEVTVKETVPVAPVSKYLEPTNTKDEQKVTTNLMEDKPKSIVPMTGYKENNSEFKFSAPLVLAEYLKPLKALNNFKFSEPLIKKRRSIHPELDDQENKNVGAKKAMKNNGESVLNWSKPMDTINVDNSMEKPKVKQGTWECSVCLIKNQPEKIKCIACENPNPKSKTSNVKPPPAQTPLSSNTWECPTCMIRNKDELLNCAACYEKKPDKTSSNASKGASLSFNPAAQTKIAASVTPSVPFVGFGNKFAASSDTWECCTCMIRNKNEVMKCVACETAKPQTKVDSADRQSVNSENFGNGFKKKDDEWECSVCMVRNKVDADKCQCCESSNPNAKLPSSSSTSSKVPSFSFGIDKNTVTSFTFGIPAGAQVGEEVETKTNASQVFGENRTVPTTETPSFTFGVNVNPVVSKEEPKKDADLTKPTFSFSVKTSEPTPTPSTDSQTPSKVVPTFSFGATTSKTETTTMSPAFSFGLPKKSDDLTGSKPVTPSFSFGATKKSDDVEIKTATPSFSFGSVSNNDGKCVPNTFSFGSGNKTSNENEENRNSGVAKVNPLLRPNDKLPEKATVAPLGFSFTSPKMVDSSTVEPTSNKRQRSSFNEVPKAKVPMFSFNAPTTNGDTDKGAALFSKPSEENKNPTLSSGGFNFSFSAGKTTSTATVAPTFGNVVSQAETPKQTAAAPMFNFGSSLGTPKQTNGFSFGSSPHTFGSKPSTETKPFTFGSPSQSSQAPLPSFGNSLAKTNTFSFGSATENKPTATPFTFNAPSTENKAAPQFGATQSKPQPTFGFTNQSTTPTFNFGSNQPMNSMNTFGSASNKPESVFGAAPTQSSGLNGTFNFGAVAASNQKAGFSFGAPSSTSQNGPMQGGFNFGSSGMNSGMSSGSRGFNFSAPTAPTFDSSTKPTFNFTEGAGMSAVSVPPAQEGHAPQRKIRRAQRRTAQR